MKRMLMVLALIFLIPSLAQAQAFSSGSTGADGPLDLTSGDRTVQLPESGILNYTTVNIPAGRILSFKRNSRNTPVYMLAQGSVTISGIIDVSAPLMIAGGADTRTPGPGGFYGGDSNQNGFGPGGGLYTTDRSQLFGRWVGPLSLVPIIGGSGGAGHPCCFNGSAYGGGGGGAIVIASSTSIVLPGTIRANGFGNGAGGPGSGGAIRLVANSLSVSGSFQAADGDYLYNRNNPPHYGVVHLEAPAGALAFTGSSEPPVGLFAINPTITQPSSPALTILSVGGFPVPSSAGQRFDTYDMLLPSQMTDPINVVVQASNIPVGTQVSIGVVNGSPNATTTSATLQGTLASSTATPTISNLNRSAVTYLLATATFDPPASAASFNQKGANYVNKVRVESVIGAKPKFVFLRKDGSTIDAENLAPQFLAQFGQ